MMRSTDHMTTYAGESEDIIKQFEHAWLNGNEPLIRDFLDLDLAQRLPLLIELVHIDLEFRYRKQEQPAIEQYLERHPELVQDEEALIELIGAEYQHRRRHGHSSSEEEFIARFPQYRDKLLKQLTQRDSTQTWPRRLSGIAKRVRPELTGFEIEEELGRGGMGIVYRAWQPSLHRMVAIKTLIHGSAASSGVKKRFRHEAEAIARLDHPNIVPVYEVGEWTPKGGTTPIPYFVMKHYAGGSVANRTTPLTSNFEQQVLIVETVARAVHHAHQRGILHRDLKPSNILLDEQGQPHVVDFGLAVRYDPDDPQSMTETVMGTPAYMAPEQAHSPSQVTTAADVYGLGAVLYHLLTGQAPFRGETALAVMQQVSSEAPVRPTTLNGLIPKNLEIICLKCLEKEPGQRYESAAMVAADLERHRTGRTILAKPSPTWEKAWRAMRRHPVISTIVGIALGALITSVVVLARSNYLIRQQERGTREALEREKWMRAELVATFEREQQLQYGKRISTVSRLWASNQLNQAWYELDQCPIALRNWEWHYYHGLRHRNVTGQQAHRSFGDVGWANEMALSQDGQLLVVTPAVVGKEQVHVLRISDGKAMGKGPGVGAAIFSTDGKMVIAGQVTGGLACWQIDSGEMVWKYEGTDRLCVGLAMATDGVSMIALFEDGQTVLVNREAGIIRESIARRENLLAMGISVRQGLVGLAGPQVNEVIEANTGTTLSRFPSHGVTLIAFSEDGTIVATAEAERIIRLRKARTGEPLVTLPGHPRAIGAMSFNGDGKRLVTASEDGLIRIWDVVTGVELAVLPGRYEKNVRVVWNHVRDQIIAIDKQVHVYDTFKSTDK